MEYEMTSSMKMTWGHRPLEGSPLRMKSLVDTIIALQRLKGSRCLLSTEFQDDNLINMVLENVVEEHLVLECDSSPPSDFTNTAEYQCNVTDAKKRSLVLVQDSMKLHAVMLQGGNDHHKVYLNVSTYVPSPNPEARPVALCIKDTNLYLSCFKADAEPTLHLEHVEDKDALRNIRLDSDMMRFLFYRHDTGLNISTLMSAHFPDWYVSTEESDHRPVEMCQKAAQRYQTFTIQRQS